MPRLAAISGQPRVIATLRAAIAQGRLHHALLFAGAPGAGADEVALALAAALNCQAAPGEGCEVCASCERIFQGIHPDVVTLGREGAAQIIPIETVRGAIARCALPPHEAAVRVFLVEEASALPPASANALLKILEEPPARTMFILATSAPHQLLPTLRSRCQRVAFAPRPAALAAATDEEREQLTRRRGLADQLLAHPGGLAAAIDLAQAIAGEKGEAAEVTTLALHGIYERARRAVAEGDHAAARRDAELGRVLADTLVALTLHNAHPQLALEDVLATHRFAPHPV